VSSRLSACRTYEQNKRADAVATGKQLGRDEVDLAEPDVDRPEESLLAEEDKEVSCG
jgi:hypothetical protein